MTGLSIDARLEELRWKIEDNLRTQRTDQRSLRYDDRNYLEKTHGNISECYDTQAWQHTLGMLSALFKIAVAGYDRHDPWAKSVKGIADLCTQTTQVTVKFSESELQRFNGRVEELRDLLSNDNKREDEIRRIIQEISQMLDKAIENAHRAKSSPFLPS